MNDTNTTTSRLNGYQELVVHAKAKLTAEEALHESYRLRGKKINGNRIDRRPLWRATAALAEALAERPYPPQNRWLAWDALCARSMDLTGEQNMFDAIIRYYELATMPREERVPIMAEIRRRQAQEAEEKRVARIQALRKELEALEAVQPPG